ncbi:MAG: glycerol-3-phosphate dehydrogenase/oxidase [Ferruginibacter sp.]
MKRAEMLQQLNGNSDWDIIIIGGGATGLGAAVDAASRGFKTLLVEQEDFAKGTSSRSTKLVHGGVRYLAQGNIKLVLEALKERGLLLKNAPHLSFTTSFIIPAYKWWEKIYYGVGLKIYDVMSGRLSLGNTKIISKKITESLLPTIQKTNLKGGIIYKDGQFDDTRLAINLAQTAAENGATILNYCRVTNLIKEGNKTTGIIVTDIINQKEYRLKAKVVINATGVFTNAVLKMDHAEKPDLVSPSQGVHIVLDQKFFPGHDALMIPKTTDGRVLFAVPWHGKVVVGTTDMPLEKIDLEPRATDTEIDFILNNVNLYLDAAISRKDVKSVFAGLRPLVKISGVKKTALMPRDHTILISETGLVTITGGKWTTYRRMAKDVIDKAIASANLKHKECVTEHLKIHGFINENNKADALNFYGTDADEIKKICEEDENYSTLLHPDLPYKKASILLAVRNEMAMTVEDVLARRIRILFLDAQAAIDCAPEVATLMAKEMNKDEEWLKDQIHSFTTLAKAYLASPPTLSPEGKGKAKGVHEV